MSSGKTTFVSLRNSWKVRIGQPVLLLILFVVLASLGYEILEPEYTWFDGLYMTVITVATVGNEVVGGKLTQAGRVWTIFVIVGGLALLTVVGAQIAAFVVEGQVRGVLGRRKLKREISTRKNHVIICGFGDMGNVVAKQLSQAGKDVVVIDHDSDRIAQAGEDGYLYVLGDAQNEAVLEQAGLSRAGFLIATLDNDANNLFVTLSARQDNPKIKIIARARDVASQKKLKRAGADCVVCPQTIGAYRVADEILKPAMVEYVKMAHNEVNLEMDQIQISSASPFVHKTLEELNLPSRCGAHVVAVRHNDGKTNYHPTRDQMLEAGDMVIIVGPRGVREAMQKLTKNA